MTQRYSNVGLVDISQLLIKIAQSINRGLLALS